MFTYSAISSRIQKINLKLIRRYFIFFSVVSFTFDMYCIPVVHLNLAYVHQGPNRHMWLVAIAMSVTVLQHRSMGRRIEIPVFPFFLLHLC